MNGNTFRPCWECFAELPFCLERPFKHRFPDLSAHFFVLAGPSLSVFVGLCSLRYSEGQPGNRYYGGNEVIDKAQCGAVEL
jgi:hypothetical protein